LFRGVVESLDDKSIYLTDTPDDRSSKIVILQICNGCKAKGNSLLNKNNEVSKVLGNVVKDILNDKNGQSSKS
jgi:hypothetical protein